METTARRKDEFTVEIIEVNDPITKVNEYELKFLLKQREDIINSKNQFNSQRDQELKYIDSLIEHCKNLEIKEKPEIISNVEPIKQPK